MMLYKCMALLAATTFGIYKGVNYASFYLSKDKTKFPQKIYINGNSGFVYKLLSNNANEYQNAFTTLKKIDDELPVDIYIESYGGVALWSIAICNTIKRRTGKVRVIIDSHALSAGTIIALASDEIHFTNKHCILSAIDPQNSYVNYILTGNFKKVSDILTGDILENISSDNERINAYYLKTISNLLNDQYSDEIKENIMDNMYTGPVMHEQTFTYEELIEMGVNIQLIDDKDFDFYNKGLRPDLSYEV